MLMPIMPRMISTITAVTIHMPRISDFSTSFSLWSAIASLRGFLFALARRPREKSNPSQLHQPYGYAVIRPPAASAKTRLEAGCGRSDIARERIAHVARQRQRVGCRTLLQHHAAASSRLVRIGILREIPMRIVHLQQVVKDVANEDCMLAL